MPMTRHSWQSWDVLGSPDKACWYSSCNRSGYVRRGFLQSQFPGCRCLLPFEFWSEPGQLRRYFASQSCDWKYCPCISSFSITWEFVENADLGTLTQTYWFSNSKLVGLRNLCFNNHPFSTLSHLTFTPRFWCKLQFENHLSRVHLILVVLVLWMLIT